jgi:hypothetical protein
LTEAFRGVKIETEIEIWQKINSLSKLFLTETDKSGEKTEFCKKLKSA